MEKPVLTVKELSKRWGVSEITIRRYADEGILKKIANLPTILFNLEHIKAMEDIEDSERRSHLEIVQAKEIEKLKSRIKDLESNMLNALGILGQVISK